jgi:TonB-dependent receptor
MWIGNDMKRLLRYVFLCLVLGMCGASVIARGTLYGVVRDDSTNERLGFASVGIPALSLGTTTDLDGIYRLTNIPIGTHKVVFNYLGYQSQTLEITIRDGQNYELNITLQPEGIALDAVEVKAQAIGQAAAINQQINSNTIVNVISKEKLQELPDQNAAEAIGRLPGVSVQRDGGEGQKVVVRGLSPRFNSVTINGERIPSTDGEDRSVDLSMISPDMLSGVELFKAITPDMDADAIGGTVNFAIRKAPEGWKGDARLQYGYNGHEDIFGPWRTSFTMSNRFLNNKLGALATANFQRADRSSDLLEAEYGFGGIAAGSSFVTQLLDLNLGDRRETRDRYGASLTLDYDLKNGSIFVNSMWGRTDRDETRWRRRYRPSNAYQEYDIRERRTTTDLISNSITGQHNMGALEVRWRGSYAVSTQNTPFSLTTRFRETAALNTGAEVNAGPEIIPQGFKNDLRSTFLHDTRTNEIFVQDINATGQFDLKYNFKLGKSVNGYVKTGGKYRDQSRERDNDELLLQPYLANSPQNPARSNSGLFYTTGGPNPRIYMANFLGNFQGRPFLAGNPFYEMGPGTPEQRATHGLVLENVDINAFNNFFGTNYQLGDSLRYTGYIDPAKARAFYERFGDEYRVNQLVDLEDYTARERIYASYAMTELNFGKKWMLLGGIRYENTRQNFRSVSGTPGEEDGTGFLNLIDSVGAQGYVEWLPMAHLRYKATPWFDIRLAVTKTLSRPNYFNLVPWERINQNDFQIDRGKPDLKHTTNWNYDLFLSFYNKFGLFTIGGFYKRFDNVDYIRVSRITEGQFNGYQLTEPANAPGTSTVIGTEVDLQANFRSLGGFWRGILLGANFTIVRSETLYPFFDIINTFDITRPPFFFTEVIDTVRLGRVPGQANFIANFQFGYEFKGFSGRVSALYQGNSLAFVGQRAELDGFTDYSLRWDLAINQRLTKHWGLFFNLNNFSNQPERAFVGSTNFKSREEFFGMTGDLGVRYRF